MPAIPSKRSTPPQAPGLRPPPPPLGPQLRFGAWLLLIAAAALLWSQASLLTWSEHQLRVPQAPADPAALPLPPILSASPEQLLAHMTLALLTPVTTQWLSWLLVFTAALLVCEITLRAALIAVQQWNERRATHVFLRVRAAPLRPGDTRAALHDVDLLRALHALLPVNPWAAAVGRAPWLTLVLHARPGEPVELGIVAAAPSPAQLEALAQAVQSAIAGHAPGALVEHMEDPFPPAGSQLVVAWQRFRLAGPVELPLRTPDESEQDPLAGLASALRPTAATYTELHLALRPLRGWSLRDGWRAAGLRRLLRLQQKADHALSPDAERLEARLGLPAFAAELRVLAVATGPTAGAVATTALSQVADALAGYAERTGASRQAIIRAGGGVAALQIPLDPRQLRRLLARPAPSHAVPGLLLLAWPVRPPLLLTVAEIVGLWHLPTRATADLLRTTSCRHIPAPRQAFLPLIRRASPHPQSWIALGRAKTPAGQLAEVGLTLRDLRYVLHLTAGMGAGKSRLLANLCRQLRTTGYTLIDGKGDDAGALATFVLRLIPVADEHRVVILDPRDARWPVGLNPLAGVDLNQPGAVDLVVANVFALFARIDPETWGSAQGMRDFLDKGLRLVLAAEPHPTLANVKQALLDADYRTLLLERCRNRDVAEYWTTVFPRLGESQRASRDALLRRFDKLLSADLLRLMISQPDPELAFDTAIAERAIVIIPIPNVSLGDLAGVYAMLVFQQFLRAAFARPGDDQTRTDYPLVVDELQVLVAEAANDDIETALSRLRSLAVPLVIAHQALSQLGAVEPLVHINAENRIILKTREPDASVYGRQYGHNGLTAADIINQDPSEHQYAVLRSNGQPTGPFSIAPLDWPQVLDEALPAYAGPAWQTIVPSDSPHAEIDAYVASYAYAEVSADELNWRAQHFARLPPHDFDIILGRWHALRRLHLALIKAYPGCIPDKRERLRWCSRLRYGMPYVFAEALYRRARPEIAPEAPAEGKRRGSASTVTSRGQSQDAAPAEPPPFTQADRPPPHTPRPHSPLFSRNDDEA